MRSDLSKRLIIVSNRLPFNLKIVNNKIQIKESDGGLVAALKSYLESETTEHAETVWIGAAEFSEKRWIKFNPEKLSSLRYEVNPIFFEPKLYDKYYNGFCNATLWPLFHYFPSFVEFDDTTFEAYEQVNRSFADKILSILQPDDMLWIHDYQLMLVPDMIRKKDRTLR